MALAHYLNALQRQLMTVQIEAPRRERKAGRRRARARERSHRSIVNLALPRGIEPLFQP